MIFYVSNYGIWLEATTQICQKVRFASAQGLILPQVPTHATSCCLLLAGSQVSWLTGQHCESADVWNSAFWEYQCMMCESMGHMRDDYCMEVEDGL